MKKLVKRGLAALGVILVGVAVAGVAVYEGVGRGPDVDGTLNLPGLSAPVKVLRDAHGIPYIFAQNTPDLIRAQGFVTAQDRIFQMEGYRAIATGRLAEAIGEAGLPNDRRIRLVGLVRNAARHAEGLSPAARDFLTWYAQGINAYIEKHADDLPVELKLAGFTPRPWSLQDMTTVLQFVNWSQAANFGAELTMQRLIDKFGADKANAALAPVNVNPDRADRPVIIGQADGATRLGLAPGDLLIDPGAAALDWRPIAVGSNNWAVGKSRSASGAPIVVNDPHLDARMLPGIWHPVGLFTPDIQAVGAALPAVPGLNIGRNARVAFGVTNAYGDSQDLFIETPAPGQPDAYVDGDTIRPFQIIEEVIRIKDKAAPGGFREEKMTIRATVRGPIITGPIFAYRGDKLLSLRTAAAELPPGGGIGFDKLLIARNAAEVDRAVQEMDIIYFNFVFGDVDGAIGHRATGRVPVRASGQGRQPKPVGKTDDWQGFIPPDQMPGTLSPARDWIGTANNDTRPDAYPYDYSSFFSPSYRYRRIAEVLEQAKGTTTKDHLRLMLDTANLQARVLLPAVISALRDDPAQADLARILESWDGRDDADSAAPLVYHTIYERFAYETFAPAMGDELARAYLDQAYMWQERFDRMVTGQPGFAETAAFATAPIPDLIRKAAGLARAELAAKYGDDPKAWRWGRAHRVAFYSPLRPSGPGRDLLGFPERAMSGSGETLMRGHTPFLKNYNVDFFASMRFVADLGDAEKVQAVVSGGVVDRQFHKNQKDQLPAWSDGRLLTWWFAPAQIEANARHRQTLTP